MIRTEDDLRAVYTDPPGLDDAEQRILASIAAEPLARTVSPAERRRSPRRAWLAVAASAAAVAAVVAAALTATTAHRGSPAPPGGPVITVPGPYRHTIVDDRSQGGTPADNYVEIWTAPGGYHWERQTNMGPPQYFYGKGGLTSLFRVWPIDVLASMPTDPVTLRKFLVAHADAHIYDAAEYAFKTVDEIVSGKGFLYLPPATPAAMLRLLEGTPRVSTHQVRDPKGRPAVRVDWPGYDGVLSSLFFDPKTSAFLASSHAGGGQSDQSIIEVDETTNTVPKVVADEADKAWNTAPVSDRPPRARPVTG